MMSMVMVIDRKKANDGEGESDGDGDNRADLNRQYSTSIQTIIFTTLAITVKEKYVYRLI